MRGRRYAVYSPSRRSIASGHARVWLGRYGRSWGVLGINTSVLRAQRQGCIKFDAKKADQGDGFALREAKRALVEKGRDAYLATVADWENPCRGCPVPGLDAAYFAESGCRGCPFEQRANPSHTSSTCQNEEKRHSGLSAGRS